MAQNLQIECATNGHALVTNDEEDDVVAAVAAVVEEESPRDGTSAVARESGTLERAEANDSAEAVAFET